MKIKKKTARCGFYVLLLGALFISLFASSSVANAASQYDNVYKKTDNLYISSDYWEIDPIDITNSWSQIIHGNEDFGYKLTYWSGNSKATEEQIQAMRDLFIDPQAMAITQVNISGEKYVKVVVCSTDAGLNTRWRNNEVSITGTDCRRITFRFGAKEGFPAKHRLDIRSESVGYSRISADYSDGTNFRNYVVWGFPTNYPDGYDGEPFRDTVRQLEDLTPSIFYKVSGYDMEAMICFADFGSPEDKRLGHVCDRTKLPWKEKTIINWELKHKPSDTTTIAEYKGDDFTKAGRFDYTFKEFGTYYLIVYYSWPGVPYPNADSLGYKLHALNIPIKIDGTTYVSGSSKQKCDNGACIEYSEYKDCSTTIDSLSALGERISCEFFNFGIAIRNILNYLFIPDMSVVRRFFDDFVNRIKLTLGFLYAPIDFIVQIFNLASSQASNPTGPNCSLGSFSMFGSASSPIQLCAWRHQMPQLWSLMQVAIQGGIAFGLVFAFWRKLNALFGHNVGDDDDDSYSGSDSWDWVDERTGQRGNVGEHRRSQK